MENGKYQSTHKKAPIMEAATSEGAKQNLN